MADGGYFGRGAAIREVGAEPFALLGGGPALLLQLAHPKVARGVAEHSGFQASPFPRLFSTLDYLTMVVFGTREEAQRVAWSAMRAHDVVNGGAQSDGDAYSAHDPELLLWVQATLFQVSRELYERILGPLDEVKSEEYYQQSVLLAELLGAPREALPEDAAAFDAYWTEMVNTLEVSPEGREQALAVMHPSVMRWALFPAMAMFRLVTTGLLPEPIRVQYGFPWTPRREAAFRCVLGAVTVSMRLTPGFVRRMPSHAAVPFARRLRWRRYHRPGP